MKIQHKIISIQKIRWMSATLVWLAVIVPSMLWGSICAFKFRFKYTGFVAGAVPWTVLLVCILFTEYFLPYEGGGASMWPIAQFFGGTIAAGIGYGTYKLCTEYFLSSDQ